MGAVLERYQTAFAQALGAAHGFGFWKGRVALYAILRALGITEGDEVIMPGYTCVMAVNPIIYLGAKPIFVDIEPITYNMDPNRIEEKITTRTRLIIAQHTYGYPADMDAILDISRRRGVPVIEDCCLSLGSTYRGKVTGSFAQAAYFSFQWNKPYTTGLGGMALVADNDVAKRMGEVCEREAMNPNGAETNMLRAQLAVYRSLIYPSTTALAQNVFRLLGNVGLVVASSKASEKTTAMEPDFFKRMSAMQARAGMRQLGKLERNRAHRRRMRKRYDVLLAEHDWVVPQLPDAIDPVLVRYPVRVDDKARALRDASRHFVELGSWFECPLHPMETELSLYGYHTGMCPEADKACREVVNLPCHPRVSERTARRCVRFITALRREQMQ